MGRDASRPRAKRGRDEFAVTRVAVRLLAAVLGALAAVSCSIDAPSGAFVCERDLDCPPRQSCHADGVCRAGTDHGLMKEPEAEPDAATRDAQAPTPPTDAGLADAQSPSPDAAAADAALAPTNEGDAGRMAAAAKHPCQPSPCRHGGVCIENGDQFVCDCSGTGYTGGICSEDVDECAHDHGGCDPVATCANLPGTRTCTCPAPKTGTGIGPDSCASEVSAIALGESHSCALVSAIAYCWGANDSGQLGDGTQSSRATPVSVAGPSGIREIALGGTHTCVRLTDASITCWGQNQAGQLGTQDLDFSSTPLHVAGIHDALQLAVGLYHSCVLASGGHVQCWGDNRDGQLGAMTESDVSPTPVEVSMLSGVQELAAGDSHNCARLSTGGVACWGANVSGQAGADPSSTTVAVPVEIAGLSDVRAIAAGGAHNCARLGDDTVRCWGANDSGQLGNGTTQGSVQPVQVMGLSNVQSIVAGGTHSCALLRDGSVRCWGNNGSGQLGVAGRGMSTSPLPVAGLSDVVELAAGKSHTCARLKDHSVRCWGANGAGQLGNGQHSDSPTPVPLAL